MTKPTKWLMRPDQHWQPPSLIRVLAVRMKKPWAPSYPLSAQWRLIRLDRCPDWSESLLGTYASLLLFWWHGAYYKMLFRKEKQHLRENRRELESRKKRRLPDWEPYKSGPGMNRQTEMPWGPREPRSRQNGSGVRKRPRSPVRRRKWRWCLSKPERTRCNRRNITLLSRHRGRGMSLKGCSGEYDWIIHDLWAIKWNTVKFLKNGHSKICCNYHKIWTMWL